MYRRDHQSDPAPFSLREKIMGFLIAGSLGFTAWSLGGYDDLELHIFLLLSLLTLICSIIPFEPLPWSPGALFNLKQNLGRLLKLPFFWFSFSFLCYILIQAFNPSILQVHGENSWWVESISPPFSNHLPSSVRSDYSEINAFRVLVTHASAFCLAIGIFVGIQRRGLLLFALWAFILSASTMGFVAILQEFTNAQKILGVFESVNPNFWGTFVYRNQGAALLILNMLVCGVLYFFYARRARNALSKGGPHFICCLFLLLSFGSIWLSLSRGGIILSFLLIAGFILLFFIGSFNNAFFSQRLWQLVTAVFVLILGALFIFQFTNFKQLQSRTSQLALSISDYSSDSRMLTSKATFDMAKDRLKYGWGAGSFRYIFPIYQRNYESIWYHYFHKKNGWMGRKYYEYAHNDWVQFLAEYGVVGCVPLGLLFLYLLYKSFVKLRHFPFIILFLLLALSLIFLHNFFDFIFSSPSYWVAFWGIMALILRLLQLESKTYIKA